VFTGVLNFVGIVNDERRISIRFFPEVVLSCRGENHSTEFEREFVQTALCSLRHLVGGGGHDFQTQQPAMMIMGIRLGKRHFKCKLGSAPPFLLSCSSPLGH
jgi:hypothetical protein